MKSISRFWHDEDGLALTEYLLVLGGFIALGVLGASALSDGLRGTWTAGTPYWSTAVVEVPEDAGGGGGSGGSDGGTSGGSGGSGTGGTGDGGTSDGGTGSSGNGNGNGNGNDNGNGNGNGNGKGKKK